MYAKRRLRLEVNMQLFNAVIHADTEAMNNERIAKVLVYFRVRVSKYAFRLGLSLDISFLHILLFSERPFIDAFFPQLMVFH